MTGEKLSHIAIIMDGNRRWAKKRSLEVFSGYTKGADNMVPIVEEAIKNDIKYLTCFVFSTENWNRSEIEINYLKSILEDYLISKEHYFIENEVKFLAHGDFLSFGESIANKIINLQNKTKNFTKITVIMLINYCSRTEILRSVKKIVKNIEEGKISSSEIDEKIFTENLYSKDIPDPDLIIRTGKEKRLSNFLLWQSAYSELYFSEKMWPEFTKEDFLEAIKDFYSRERRRGR